MTIKGVWDYRRLLETFLENGYSFEGFENSISPEKVILLRHDVDLDVQLAYEMSRIELSLGITSTYFFMLSNPLYNCLEKSNRLFIEKMIEDGHTVSLHFDVTCYDDVESGFLKEKSAFEQLFDLKVDIISFHRPVPDYLNNADQFYGCDHSYHPRFFSDIAYSSDSGGRFSYGHPLESQFFLEKKSFQLLIHPIWWINSSSTSLDTLLSQLDNLSSFQKDYLKHNCKVFTTT